MHSLTCSTPAEGASFTAAWKEMGGKNPYESERVSNSQKVALPDTQEVPADNTEVQEQQAAASQEEPPVTVLQSQQTQQEQCTFCQRTFVSTRGLQQHLRSCKKKKTVQQTAQSQRGAEEQSREADKQREEVESNSDVQQSHAGQP